MGKNNSRAEAVQKYTSNQIIWSKNISNMPLFYVERRNLDQPKSRNKAATLTIFVHGYQGNSFDFQKAKNYLKKVSKHSHILIVESITEDMNQSI